MFEIARGAKALLCTFVFLSATHAAEVIYDNTSAPLGVQAAESREYGDEVILGGVARIITRFDIEYVADYTPSQVIPTMQFRIYLNDPNNFYKPGEVLWVSPVTPVYLPAENFGTHSFTDIAVVIPEGFNRITFTVQFQGLSMQTSEPRDFAGLLYYSVPTVGQSYNDFWRRTADGTDWQLVRTPQPPDYQGSNPWKSNFGARITAVPEPSILGLTTMAVVAGVWTILRRKQ